jgi:putative membrane protein
VEPSPWSWTFAWDEVLVVLVTATAYALALRTWPASRARVACFAASQLFVLAAFVTPLGTLSLDYLLSAHLLQNVVLAEWAPALAVLGLPPTLAAELGRFGLVRTFTRPLVALPLWLLTYGVWHVPAVYDAALRHHLLLHLEHGTYFLAGVLLWWPVFHDTPWRVSPGAKSVYLFGAFVLASPIGLLLALLPDAIYDFYVEAPRIWGLAPLTDQQIAGVLMALSEAVVFFSVFTIYFLRFLEAEERA